MIESNDGTNEPFAFQCHAPRLAQGPTPVGVHVGGGTLTLSTRDHWEAWLVAGIAADLDFPSQGAVLLPRSAAQSASASRVSNAAGVITGGC